MIPEQKPGELQQIPVRVVPDRRGHDGEERWEPSDEPTQLERIIASQFRRGIPIPLTAQEQTQLQRMSLEQRCDFMAKVVVFTARATQKWIKKTEEGPPK